MAAQPNGAADRVASHGRGGAGNIVKDDPSNYPKPEDLVTPTLKSIHYTTGRGGTGNIAKNDPERPDLARAAQDVEAAHSEPLGPTHYGRGGAANVIGHDGQPRKSGEGKPAAEKARRESNNNGQGLVAKGKDFLSKLGKK